MPTPDSGVILSGSAVRVKGLGSWLVWATKRLVVAWRSTTQRKTPRFSRCLASFAKNPSTALSHEHEVGVRSEARVASEPLAHLRMLVDGVIVENYVNKLPGRHLSLNGIQEADELLVPMASHTSADDLAFEHVESSEQRRCAMTLVVVGHRTGDLFFIGRQGCVRSRAWICDFSSTERTMAWAGRST